MPPSDPAAVCLCGSPHADWDANGVRVCATCAANIVVASGSFVTPAAVPPPEWARKMVLAYYQLPADAVVDGFDVDELALLLASVREGALREAAAKCLSQSRLIGHRIEGIREGWSKSDAGQLSRYEGWVASANWCEQDILSLLHTPPSGGAG